MTAATDTDIQQIKDLITAGQQATQKQITDLTVEMRVGFAQVDTKLAQVDTRIAQVDTKLAELKGDMDTKLAELKGEMNTGFARVEGDINLLKQPRDFWDFVRRAVTSGLVVTVVGGLLLSAWKLLIFGQVS